MPGEGGAMNEEAMLGEILGNINVQRAGNDINGPVNYGQPLKSKDSYLSFYPNDK